MLTKKHLQNAKFMEYLIDFFDNSRYVKPLYIIEVEKNMLQQRNIRFKQFPVNTELMEKLCSSVSLIIIRIFLILKNMRIIIIMPGASWFIFAARIC
ncbi:hypothetical protein ATZ36_17590 [Candidatus Endomicrobiellum trichonymphae]|uniref:Uncharacterized protein n=1 Tax=Endomicrobium trichonymphae TaxID=1408204 RepID=A0A1E5IJV9_ENDTX|nr:hypothetical protein ATZ36_17590 [Candidatus Endomicrobium trichonymphae]